MASTPRERTRKTGSDHACFVVLAAPAYHAFFCGHRTRRSLWAHTRAEVSSFGSLKTRNQLNKSVKELLKSKTHVDIHQTEPVPVSRNALLVVTAQP